jgi:hypothetical protein
MQYLGSPDDPNSYGDGSGSGGKNGDEPCPYTDGERRFGYYGYQNYLTAAAYLANPNVTANNTLKVGGSGATEMTTIAAAWNIDHTGWMPIGSAVINHYFRGNFDGNGKVISNLVINRPAGNYQGLFGYTTVGATIKNIGIENCNITGSVEVGGLVGRSLASSIINCYATGNVTGTGGITGGLVGTLVGSYLTNCYVSGNVTGINLVGGLTGLISDDSSEINHITNCYAISEVIGNDMVGGLVGLNVGGSSTIDSYACGNVTGNNWVGGLIGATQINANSIENCYAFNCKVDAAGTNVGRIIGGWLITATNLINNYAHEQMELWENGTPVAPTPNPDGKDGADISYENAINPATYAAWLGTAWTFDYSNYNVTPETNLPILTAFPKTAFPNAVQVPQVEICAEPNSAVFYANNVHCDSLYKTTFCAKEVHFQAEIEGDLHPDSGRIKWFIDGNEHLAVRDSLEWNWSFETGGYEIELQVRFADDIVFKRGFLKMEILWIKMRNVRY